MQFGFLGRFLIMAMLVSACNGNRVFEEYKGFDSGSWNIADTVSFEFNTDPTHSNVLIGVKYGADYEFRNLYVRYLLMDSLDRIVENKLLDIPLFESTSGAPVGKGFGDTFTRYDTLPIGRPFSRIAFIQYMRTDELEGMEAVGLKVVKK